VWFGGPPLASHGVDRGAPGAPELHGARRRLAHRADDQLVAHPARLCPAALSALA